MQAIPARPIYVKEKVGVPLSILDLAEHNEREAAISDTGGNH
jgi:hypothetical protein